MEELFRGKTFHTLLRVQHHLVHHSNGSQYAPASWSMTCCLCESACCAAPYQHVAGACGSSCLSGLCSALLLHPSLHIRQAGYRGHIAGFTMCTLPRMQSCSGINCRTSCALLSTMYIHLYSRCSHLCACAGALSAQHHTQACVPS